MNKYFFLATSLAAVVLIGLGGLLIYRYGKSEYDRGRLSAIGEINEATIKHAQNQSREQKAIIGTSDADIIDGLRKRAARKSGQ